MDEKKIARINELARKAKAEGLNVTCETAPTTCCWTIPACRRTAVSK